MLLAQILTAIFAGLAVILATVALVVAVKALYHDRVQTGTRQPVIVRRGNPNMPWDAFDPDPLPNGWVRERTRWVPVRLINRARYPIDVEGPTHARLGLFRRPVEIAPSAKRTISSTGPEWFYLRMQKPGGWSKRRLVRLRVRWEAAEGRVRFRGWITLKDVPPAL